MKVGQNADKKKVLEELLELGMVLVAIDARNDGVDVPNHLGVDPQLRLNLSYRFGRPMQVDAWGISAELTFGGVPYNCRFPWSAVFLIVSHINGESYLFPDHVPQELLHQAEGEQAASEAAQAAQTGQTQAKQTRPKLSLVRPTEDEPPAQIEAKPGPVDAPGADDDDGKLEPAFKANVVVPDTKPNAAPKAAPADTDVPSEDAAPESSPKKPARNRGHLRLIK